MAQRARKPEVHLLERAAAAPAVGRVVSFERGVVRVEHAGHTGGPLRARTSAALDDAALQAAAHGQQEALLVFEGGDPARPVVVALLRSETPLTDALLAGPLPRAGKTARLDGKRVELEGQDEVVLRCGKASLTLRRDGKVVLRGVNVVTQADQVHKVRGGKVQIN
ncbi:MAG: DUF6484 domain-containing protein [Anaeromyxobacter sp.]